MFVLACFIRCCSYIKLAASFEKANMGDIYITALLFLLLFDLIFGLNVLQYSPPETSSRQCCHRLGHKEGNIC